MEIEPIEPEPFANRAKIKVMGVGGGGGNAVQHMIDSGLRGVQFICANTDAQALKNSAADCKIQIGERLTKGLGSGADPAVGREAALESVAAIKEYLADADMVFVAAGMGKGTGTGAAPVIAQLAKEQGALTVGVVTKPFSFEGAKRKAAAELGIAEFRQHVDCLITIPNDRLMTFASKKAPFKELLSKANDILHCAVKGISDVITSEGDFNVDFADVRTTMREVGLALMGTGVASGENRAREAATRAITSPLLEDVSIDGAKAVLYNITASKDILADEIQEIGDTIRDAVHPDANVIWGMVFDDNAGDTLRITVIATGIEAPPKLAASPGTGKVTIFREKSPPAREQTLQTPLTALAEGTQRQPRRVPHQWYDEKSDRPAFDRKRQAVGHRKAHPHVPGEEDFLFDEDEFEMPAFIRRQAD